MRSTSDTRLDCAPLRSPTKNKQRVERPESERFVVKNTHEAPRHTGAVGHRAGGASAQKRVPKHMDEPNIFSGLVFCADCGKPLVLHRASTMKKTEYNFKEERLRQRRNCVAIDKD